MTSETRFLLANCGASLLLFVAFLLLALLTAGSYLLWRGLMQVRAAVPEGMSRIGVGADLVAARTRATTVAVVSPQIRLVTAWAGLRAGVRALLGRSSAPAAPIREEDRRRSP